MHDDYDGGFESGESGMDMAVSDAALDTGASDTALEVDTLMDTGVDDFAQFELPAETDGLNAASELDDIPVADPVEGSFEQHDESSDTVLKRDEFDLLQTGYNNVNDILDAKADDYYDKGFSEAEVSDLLAKDKWTEQQAFLNDAFPGQDVSPNVFNGFEENGAASRIKEMENSEALTEHLSSNGTEGNNDASAFELPESDFEQLEAPNEIAAETGESSSDVDAIMDTGADDFAQFAASDIPADIPEDMSIEASEEAAVEFPAELPVEDASLEWEQGETKELSNISEVPENIEQSSEMVSEDLASPEAVPEKLEPSPDITQEDIQVDWNELSQEAAQDTVDESDNFVEQTDAPYEIKEQVAAVNEVEEIPGVENIKEWLGDINPNYNPEKFDEYHVNCGSCALATFKKFGGDSSAVAGAETLSVEEMNAGTGMEQVEMTPDDIGKYVLEQGPGKMYVVGFDRAPVDGMPVEGHWFNAYNDNGKVIAIDSQDNSVYDWPPPSPPYNGAKWDISVGKENAR